MILALAASLSYLLSVILLNIKTGKNRIAVLVTMAVAISMHFCQVAIEQKALMNDTSLMSILTLVTFCMSFGAGLRYLLKSDSTAYSVVSLMTAILVWFPVIFTMPATHVDGWPIKFHIVLSIFSYIAIGFAALYACFLLLQDYRFRRGKGIFDLALPLNEIERTMIMFTVVGEFLLTLSLVTGTIFIYDLWEQHVAHKFLFGIISWLIIITLLWRHYRQGFRGTQAALWLLSGFAFLVLSYFGTAFFLQIVLT